MYLGVVRTETRVAAGCRIRKGDPNLELFSDRVILGLKRRREMSAGENGSKLLLPPLSYSSEFLPLQPTHPFWKRKESLEKLFRHANVEGHHPFYPIFEDYSQLKILI